MALSMSQVPAALGVMGAAVDDYTACRGEFPSKSTPGVLTQSDPCYSDLVAWRRAQGRDPLGRDIWGPRGAPGPRPPRDETLQQNISRCMEETGLSRETCEYRFGQRDRQSQIVVIPPSASARRSYNRYSAPQMSISQTPEWLPYAIGALVVLGVVSIMLPRRGSRA